VSRTNVEFFEFEIWCFVNDGSWPPGIGVQALVSNYFYAAAVKQSWWGAIEEKASLKVSGEQ